MSLITNSMLNSNATAEFESCRRHSYECDEKTGINKTSYVWEIFSPEDKVCTAESSEVRGRDRLTVSEPSECANFTFIFIRRKSRHRIGDVVGRLRFHRESFVCFAFRCLWLVGGCASFA